MAKSTPPRAFFHIDSRARLMSAFLTSAGNDDDLFTSRALSEAVGTSRNFFEQLRCRDQGPAASMIGGRLYYQRRDVVAWLESRGRMRRVSAPRRDPSASASRDGL
jgi:hypothetical protein